MLCNVVLFYVVTNAYSGYTHTPLQTFYKGVTGVLTRVLQECSPVPKIERITKRCMRRTATQQHNISSGAMLVFDVTSASSFENIRKWVRELKDHANRDIVLVLVGNKADLVLNVY
jgi:GTPase SAR1 family protein